MRFGRDWPKSGLNEGDGVDSLLIDLSQVRTRDLVFKISQNYAGFIYGFFPLLIPDKAPIVNHPHLCYRRMKRDDFVRNLRGIDAGADLDEEMLHGIYDRLKANEFRPGSDHVSQVSEAMILGNQT